MKNFEFGIKKRGHGRPSFADLSTVGNLFVDKSKRKVQARTRVEIPTFSAEVCLFSLKKIQEDCFIIYSVFLFNGVKSLRFCAKLFLPQGAQMPSGNDNKKCSPQNFQAHSGQIRRKANNYEFAQNLGWPRKKITRGCIQVYSGKNFKAIYFDQKIPSPGKCPLKKLNDFLDNFFYIGSFFFLK